ncbi:MAG: PorP/SprF family type IX secretion system membrane protein [Bacteroidales bacterium]|nr:PorP/SprF family type IX secretion system membrane protein [Bacteroidales bacterium]
MKKKLYICAVFCEVMMKRKIVIYCVFLLALIKQGLGQDIHFSQIDINPVLLNPAYSGFFEGKGRFGAIYRNQWQSVSEPYETFAFTAEWNAYRRRYFGDGINVGMAITRDEAGSLNYGTTQADVIFSYFKGLNKANNHFVSAGLSVGFGQQSFDPHMAILPDQAETFNVQKSRYLDLGIGAAWFYNPIDVFTIKVGVSAKHLNKPNISYMNLDESYLHPNFNAYTRMEVRFAEFFSFLPVVMYRFQHKYHELLYGTDIKWYCYQSYKYDVNCSAGVYMRQTDAVVFSFTLEFDSFVFGAAYDYNFSDLKPASNGVGGFEIALLYRLKEHRQKKGNTITCPTFL